MKREFLQSIQVGEAKLPKEVIDAIMAENGRDIQAAREAAVKPFADYDAVIAENGRLKSEALADGKSALQWKQEMLDWQFQASLETAIAAAGGKSCKAITAMLDCDALKASDDRKAAIDKALAELKKTDGYLFGSITPPPYAGGTGTPDRGNFQAPADLAGALREKFERK